MLKLVADFYGIHVISCTYFLTNEPVAGNYLMKTDVNYERFMAEGDYVGVGLKEHGLESLAL